MKCDWPLLLLASLSTAFCCWLIPIYWRDYGPSNFLWFSDIALFLMTLAMWLRSSTLASIATVSVFLLETAWNLDFFIRLFTGFNFVGLTEYMFEKDRALYLKAISLIFHAPMPLWMWWTLRTLGYDPRAMWITTLLAWIVLPATYFLSRPDQNINWVYGFGQSQQTWMPPLAWLGLLMIGFPLLVYLPTHLMLKKLLPKRRP